MTYIDSTGGFYSVQSGRISWQKSQRFTARNIYIIIPQWDRLKAKNSNISNLRLSLLNSASAERTWASLASWVMICLTSRSPYTSSSISSCLALLISSVDSSSAFSCRILASFSFYKYRKGFTMVF